MDGRAAATFRRRVQRLGGSSSFLPFASARADGVVRAPVSAACVWALRTPLETSRRARLPAHAPQTTLGPPTCVTVENFRRLAEKNILFYCCVILCYRVLLHI